MLRRLILLALRNARIGHCRYTKLAWLKKAKIIAFNSALVRIFTILRIAPAGIQDVHDMLVKVAQSLVAGGETGKLAYQSDCAQHLKSENPSIYACLSTNVTLRPWFPPAEQIGQNHIASWHCWLVSFSHFDYNRLQKKHRANFRFFIQTVTNSHAACRSFHTYAFADFSEARGLKFERGWISIEAAW